MNFEVTWLKIGFGTYIFKTCDIFANSKNLFNQNISMDSKISVEILWYKTIQKSSLLLGEIAKKTEANTKTGKHEPMTLQTDI